MDIFNGWFAEAKRVPSPNFNERPGDAAVDALVIHNISLPPGQFGAGYIEKLFLNQLPREDHPYFETIADMTVSSHLLISREGELTQFVALDKRAWHAGQSVFCGKENCNDFSIGIELEGADDVPYTSSQYDQLVRVTKALIAYFEGLNSQRITGHSDIAPGRKTDPGPAFDWQRYLEQLA